MTLATGMPVAPLFSFPFLIDPEPTLDWLRENDPLHVMRGADLIVLTRHADCAAALVHPDLSAAGGQEERSKASGAPASMLNTDGSDHQRLRRPGGLLLGPAALRRLGDRLEQVAGEVADSVGTGTDLSRDVSEPYASRVLAAVLGIGPEHLAEFDAHARAVAVALDPMPRTAAAQAGQRAVEQLHLFASSLLDEAAADSPLGELDRAELPRADALGIISLATVGGWSPLAELSTVAVHRILADPTLRAAAADPGWLDRWCEDTIRWHTPIPFVSRRALRDADLPSGQVPAGTQLLVHIGAGDRDGQRYREPGEIDEGRELVRDHLAFGAGPHFCLGAGLVRAAVPALIAALLRRHPEVRLRALPLVWQPTAFPRRPISTVLDLP